MKVSSIDKLIRSVHQFRVVRSLLQILLLLLSAFLFYTLTLQIEQKYLLYLRIPAFLIAAGVLFFLVIRIVLNLRSETGSKIAHELDARYSMKERLSTYIELKNSDHPFLTALTKETEKQIDSISAFRSANFARGMVSPIILPLLFILLLITIPYWPVPAAIAARTERTRSIQREGKELVKKIELINKDLKIPQLKSLAEEIKKTAREMEKPNVEPLKTMKDLNALQQKLKQAEKELDQQLRKSFEEKSRLSGKATKPGEGSENDKESLNDASKELMKDLEQEGLEGGQQIEQALQNGTLTKEQLEKMKQSLKEYKQQKEEQQQKMAELEESLKNAQKGMRSAKSEVVYNSQLNDRDVDKSKGGVEDGPGTTNKDIGPHKFDTTKKGEGQYKEDRTKADYEKLYEGQREDVGKDPLFVGSQWDAEKSQYVKIRTFGNNSETIVVSQASETVPQSQDESVITKEKIPAAYRDMIRKYFESIGQ